MIFYVTCNVQNFTKRSRGSWSAQQINMQRAPFYILHLAKENRSEFLYP